jgi:hypothetical protein
MKTLDKYFVKMNAEDHDVELANLLQGGDPSHSSCKRVIQLITIHRIREPAVVQKCAEKLLKSSGLGDSQWDIQEQLVIAAADLLEPKQFQAFAKPHLAALKKRFPKSNRVRSLEGLVKQVRCLDGWMDVCV